RNDDHLEDIVSHAFASAFENLAEFRGEASFFTWIYRIAMNESVAAYRKPGSVSLDDLADGRDSHLLTVVIVQESLDKMIADKEVSRRALRTLERLPLPYREVLEMFFLQDLSYERIAKKLHIPQGTVMSRLYRARRLLQEAWRKVPAAIAR